MKCCYRTQISGEQRVIIESNQLNSFQCDAHDTHTHVLALVILTCIIIHHE